MNLENPTQIESKLEQESGNLSQLKDHVDKYHDLSTSMSTILTKFEQRLGKLEQTILPVYNQTEHLQKRQKNLQSTLQCLENVLSHYEASQEQCNLIHLGPSEGDVADFLTGLDKLKRAKDYFLNYNPQSVELENVTSLFNTGCTTLENHYKALLKKYSTVLKPVDLLDLIYIEEDSSNEDCTSIKQMTQSTREELNTISNWLEYNLRRDYIDIYAAERSQVVFRSLQLLKDHQRTGSWENESSRTRGTYATGPVKVEQTRKTTSTRIQHLLERKANKMLMKASQTLEQSTGISLKKSTNTDHNAHVDIIGDRDQELDKYLVLLLGLQRLFIWERTLMAEVIPKTRHNDLFSRLAQSSIEMVVKDAEGITGKAMRNIQRKRWSSSLEIFSALRHFQLLQPDIERACDVNQRQQINLILLKLQQTGIKALDQFLEFVKSDSGSNLVGMSASTLSSNVPKDATVHELTSNAIWYLEHLLEHCGVISDLLCQDSFYVQQLDSLCTNKSVSTDARVKIFVGLYVKRVLSELNLTIVSKCEQYGDYATRQLFRLNNIHYILKSLQRSNVLELLLMTEPECERNYMELIQELHGSYQRSWARLISMISPLEDLPRPVNGRVKDKERSILKERFSGFNKELEEACKIQRAISVPDVILREGLKRDNSENIIPQYNAFFESYADVQFSKNPEKYVKYKPQDVSAMLGNLFDDSFQ
ncbi:exocyst complex component 7 isoform X1 [Contarinia nasturtii]|uniref:exocyst complex component 7 isoform X1 n=1 Tax=Contarinia nasturtii TaxID=265458 RepID=UPI0012D3777A|nr:exocyst complex component 7 isoform X1 [Contarinia nasturtii]